MNPRRTGEESTTEYDALGKQEFEDLILGFVQKLGYVVQSAKLDERGVVSILAKKDDPVSGTPTFIEARQSKKKTTLKHLKKLSAYMQDENVTEAIYFTTGGLSSGAEDYAAKNSIRVVGGRTFAELAAKHGLSEKEQEVKPAGYRIFEEAFKLGVSREQATEYFESKKSKTFMGVFGVSEKVVDVVEGYIPVGAFELTRTDEVRSGAMTTVVKKVVKSNTFFVGLSNLNLFYVEKSLFSKGSSLGVSDILHQSQGLSDGSINILSKIMREGVVPAEEMNRTHPLFMDEHRKDFLLLQSKGLISIDDSKTPQFLSNLDILPFDNQKYNLKEYAQVETSVNTSFPTDPITYEPNAVLEMLKLLFEASGSFRGITYLPYYKCKFVDDNEMFRYEIAVQLPVIYS